MRVTQSMLTVNTLRHITGGYDRLGKIQDQLASGKKITRASQDPVIAMNGMRYRSQVIEVDQFKRNLGEVYNWMDNADSTLDKTTNALHRIRELAVQASNDTYESTQRANMAKEIDQLLDHVIGMANTKSNGKFIFNGTNTTNEPVNRNKMDIGTGKIQGYSPQSQLEIVFEGKTFQLDSSAGPHEIKDKDGNPLTPAIVPAADELVFKNGNEILLVKTNGNQNADITHYKASVYDDKATPPQKIISQNLVERDVVVSEKSAVSTNTQDVNVELLKGVNINTNITPQNVYNNALFGDIIRLKNLLEDPDAKSEDITKAMDVFDKHIDNFVSERAELGARVNRVEMIEARLMEQEVIAKRIMSNNEDADMEKVIIDLMTQESVHRAALSAGARIMQPTLMDFLR